MLVIVGDNDVRHHSVGYILSKFLEFRDAVWPTQAKFAGHTRRKDLNMAVVSSNNIFLSEKLGRHYKSTKLIKREDFDEIDMWHLDRHDEGYRHLCALILSVLDEFVVSW